MKHLSKLLLVETLLAVGACSFQFNPGPEYPECRDGGCSSNACVCLDGKACVPRDGWQPPPVCNWCDMSGADGGVDFNTDPMNCGGCGTICGQNQACVVGECLCKNGWGNCDFNPENGCEANLVSAVEHCSRCDKSCAGQFPKAGARCVDGACIMGACNEGFLDCVNGATDGCETRIDALHCGRCDNACDPLESCVSGECRCGTLLCPNGESCCGTYCANLSSDPRNCESCGKVCVPAPPTCQDGQTLLVYAPGCSEGTCTGSGTTITCPDVCVDNQCQEDPCEKILCDSGESCDGGFCKCGGTGVDCNPEEGETCCGTSCVDLRTATNHCGKCLNDCSLLPNVLEVACNNGTCVISACRRGFGNCDTKAENGCEDDLHTDDHCSSCEDACSESGQYCAYDQCVNLCAALPSKVCNGQCTNINRDPMNCGACEYACADGLPCNLGTCGTPFVLCSPDGSTFCNVGELCCVTLVKPANLSCSASGTCATTAWLECDGPEDCSGTNVCCFKPGTGSRCIPHMDCAGQSGTPLCSSDRDCNSNFYCCPTTFAPWPAELRFHICKNVPCPTPNSL